MSSSLSMASVYLKLRRPAAVNPVVAVEVYGRSENSIPPSPVVSSIMPNPSPESVGTLFNHAHRRKFFSADTDHSDRAREVLEKERARISQSLQALSLSEVEEIRKQAQAIVKIFKGGDEEESGDGEPGEEARGDSADGEGVEGGSGDGETGEEAREDSADGQGVEVGSGDDEAGEEARGDSADGQGVKVVSGDDEAGEEARGDSAVGEGVHD